MQFATSVSPATSKVTSTEEATTSLIPSHLTSTQQAGTISEATSLRLISTMATSTVQTTTPGNPSSFATSTLAATTEKLETTSEVTTPLNPAITTVTATNLIDECALFLDNCDRVVQECIDQQIGYTCECRTGYTLDSTGKCTKLKSFQSSFRITGLVDETGASQEAVFTTDLTIRTSESFISLEITVCSAVALVYRNDPLTSTIFISCSVIRFAPGSIKAEYTIELASNSTVNETYLQDTMKEAVLSDTLNNTLRVANDSIIVSALNECEADMDDCSDNAICTDTEDYFTCSCVDGYTDLRTDIPGRYCSLVPISPEQDYTIIIIASSVTAAVLLIIALVLVVVHLLRRRKKRRKSSTYSLESPDELSLSQPVWRRVTPHGSQSLYPSSYGLSNLDMVTDGDEAVFTGARHAGEGVGSGSQESLTERELEWAQNLKTVFETVPQNQRAYSLPLLRLPETELASSSRTQSHVKRSATVSDDGQQTDRFRLPRRRSQSPVRGTPFTTTHESALRDLGARGRPDRIVISYDYF
ncbi:uncharacterized protein LOC119729475 [Patiria miniata]|uniref:EGF-like domain-containing protein n=1 Tax=Patiria miniata TaxID=46514 RepID=A0A914A295_PATMI|nr:uncharacterized protein LOC119729475 [Patiria miniata]